MSRDVPALHPREEHLEEYCLGMLSEVSTALLELHLLLCHVCRERLAWIDEYVIAMRGACADLVSRRVPHSVRRPSLAIVSRPAPRG